MTRNALRETSRYIKPVVPPRDNSGTNPGTIQIVLNDDKNGIEISFPGKPDEDVRTALKSHGFRWHRRFKFWYARQTEGRLRFADSLIQEGE